MNHEPKDCVIKVPLTAAQYLALKHVAENHGLGMASLTRLAITRYLAVLVQQEEDDMTETGHDVAKGKTL